MNDHPVPKLLERLRSETGFEPRRHGRGWLCRCPAKEHGRGRGDQNPSLSVSEGRDGQALVFCHAGCACEAIVKALGLVVRDLVPPRDRGDGRGRIVATYDYRDGQGELLYQVVRFEPKGFCQRRPDGKGGWIWKLGRTPRVLYRTSELLAAAADEWVHVVEGEQDADRLALAGFLATTNPGGAGKWSKLSDDSALHGRRVAIIPDRDGPGRKHAEEVARRLHGRAKEVRVVQLPSGKDVSDWLDSGGSPEALRELVASAEPWESAEDGSHAYRSPVLVNLAEVEPESVRWLWAGRFALGKLTLIAGDPDLGKSFITLDMAARVSSGTPWPDTPDEPNPTGGVVLLSAEDDVADTIRPRLDSAGAHVSRIEALQAVRTANPETGATHESPFDLARDLDELEVAICSVKGCRLVVIDPISAYMPHGRSFDSHRNTDVRTVLAPLVSLAARCGVAVVAVTHLRKGDGPAIYRAMGSLAFTAAARAVWGVGKDPNDPTGPRRLMLPIKNNLAAAGSGLAYELRQTPNAATAVVFWDSAPVTTTADEAFAPERRYRGPVPAERTEAEHFLRELLADGPVSAKDVPKAARDAGLSWATVRRAKDELGIRPRREGFGDSGKWLWSLPKDAHRPRAQKR